MLCVYSRVCIYIYACIYLPCDAAPTLTFTFAAFEAACRGIQDLEAARESRLTILSLLGFLIA